MTPDIKDIRGPIDIPSAWTWVWIALAVIIGAAIVAAVVIYFLRRPKKEEVIEVEPASPWEKAYARLENLRLKNLIERPNLKPFYSELSDIVRHYIEERFSLKAPEMTTEEFLESLQASPVLNDVQKLTLREFLFTCDLVKFAKHQPTVAEAQKSFDLVKALIGQTHGI